jgi:hypothetical protein
MSTSASPWDNLSVYARWRPLTNAEEKTGEIERQSHDTAGSLKSLSINCQSSTKDRPWSSPPAFAQTFDPYDDNAYVFNVVVAPALPKVLRGASCNFFAYGHSGSGKTHTITGYDYEQGDRLGICLAAARSLFESLNTLNQDSEEKLGVGFSLFELRKNSAFDLLHGRTECYIREGYDGKTHIRGPTEMLEDGKVRVRPIVKRPCWTFDELRQELQQKLGLRAVGSSSVHDQSSRTHAVLELEIINIRLVEAREAVTNRQSELVPVGKRADDVRVEESMKSLVRLPDGGWAPNPDRPINQTLVDAAEAERALFEARVAAAEEHVTEILGSKNAPSCLGGKLVFVDLAGAEYQQDKSASMLNLPNQTPQERQQGRQINTDLLALKEVIRACAANRSRIPFRSSPLTMVLREHFRGSNDGTSAMIVTVSPAKDQYAATLNSLKYGSLIGVAGS